jgi:hypothetical protein
MLADTTILAGDTDTLLFLNTVLAGTRYLAGKHLLFLNTMVTDSRGGGGC